MRRHCRMLGMVVSLVIAFSARAAESGIETLIDRLGASEMSAREEAREALSKRLAALGGGELKAALRQVLQAAEGHRDPEVREKAKAALAPYAGGEPIWEFRLERERSFDQGLQALVTPEGIVIWGQNAQKNWFLRMVEARTGRLLWEKKPLDLSGPLQTVKLTPEGLWVGGSCGQERSWHAIFSLKTGKAVQGQIFKGVGNAQEWARFYDVDGNLLIYVGSGNIKGSQLGLFDPATGEPHWILQDTGNVQVVGKTIVGVDARPRLVDGQTMYVNQVIGFDAATGREHWRREPSPQEWSWFRGTDEGIVAFSGNALGGKLTLVDPKTGKAHWSAEVPKGQPFVIEAVPGGVLLAGPQWKELGQNCFARLYDVRDGSVTWDAVQRVPAGDLTQAVHVPDRGVFLAGADRSGKGWMMLVDFKTGKPLWEKKTGALPGRPVAAEFREGELWVQGEAAEKGAIWIGAYSAADGKARAEVILEGKPVLDQHEPAYLACQIGQRHAVLWNRAQDELGVLRCFDLVSGRERWTKDVPGFQPRSVQILPCGLLVAGSKRDGQIGQEDFLGLYRVGGMWEEDSPKQLKEGGLPVAAPK